jgi:NADH-quinone oxidoreductase subunit C
MKNAIKRLIESRELACSPPKSMPIDETQIAIPPENLHQAVEILLDETVWHLSTITCRQEENILILLYHFWDKSGLSLRTSIPLSDPHIDSLCPLIPGAEFYEREIREMFGVKFIGLPNPAALLLPDDWQGGYPMRKKLEIKKKREEA